MGVAIILGAFGGLLAALASLSQWPAFWSLLASVLSSCAVTVIYTVSRRRTQDAIPAEGMPGPPQLPENSVFPLECLGFGQRAEGLLARVRLFARYDLSLMPVWLS
jgi:hypothetical protein